MREKVHSRQPLRLLTCAALLQPAALPAPVPVRHTEGLVHGFLVLSSMEGNLLALGDLIQVAVNDRLTNHLVFRFKDGSLHDETAVFSQHGSFRLLTYHLVQRGPTFEQPREMSFDSSSGAVIVHYAEHNGKETNRNRSPGIAAGHCERHGVHTTEEYWVRGAAHNGVDGGCHAKAETRAARSPAKARSRSRLAAPSVWLHIMS
jgi:hypothetical protein